MSPDAHSNGDHECHIRPDLIAVRPEDLDTASGLTPNQGAITDDEFEELVVPRVRRGDVDQRQKVPGAFEEVVRPLELVGLLRVESPRDAVERLRNGGLDAAPIHAIGFEGHRGVMTAVPPRPSTRTIEGEEDADAEKIVAVVDSGIAEPGLLPAWMSAGMVFEGEDIETADASYDKQTSDPVKASHGTFVASIYRRLLPSHTVSLAAALPHPSGDNRLDPAPDDTAPPTDELQVLDAITRLINRHWNVRQNVRLLNLSLGAYRCGESDPFLLTLEQAIDRWRQAFGYNAPVFAAGGNAKDEREVYPAAFPWVRGVGAVREPGTNQVVWDGGAPESADPRAWITDTAVGLDVHGLSGVDPEDTIDWDGSSFATAVAGATYLRHDPSLWEVSDGITVWK